MNVIDASSIGQYVDYFGLPHSPDPLVSVVRFGQRMAHTEGYSMNFGFYTIFLKNNKGCVVNYGRTEYDYDEGSIVSFAPGQTVSFASVNGVTPSSVGLLFHPDLLNGTQLGSRMGEYGFFSYSSAEALHPSAEERVAIEECIGRVEQELAHEPDRLSRRLIVAHIEVLLNYCLRFYERQFDSRKSLNHDAVAKFETLLDGYFSDGMAEREGLPTVGYFADKICLTPNYFGDMVKRETGLNPKELINRKVVSLAKSRIVAPNATVKETAFSLGFQYPQHFVRFFKKETGLTPSEYVRSVG